MKPRATEELLGKLHDAVAKTLLAKVQSGEATPAEINAAIKFLKDNGIEAIAEKGDVMDKLALALPKFDDDLTDENYLN